MTVKIRLNTGIINDLTVTPIFQNPMYPAEEGLTAGSVNALILQVRRNVGHDENFCEAGLPVEIAAGKQKRVTVQIVQHVTML